MLASGKLFNWRSEDIITIACLITSYLCKVHHSICLLCVYVAVRTIRRYVSRAVKRQQAPWSAASYFSHTTLSSVKQLYVGPLLSQSDGSAAPLWQQTFHYTNQQSQPPPLNDCHPRYLPQHQIGLASKWRIWIIHSTNLPPFPLPRLHLVTL